MRAGSGRLGVSAPPAPSDPARRWLTAPVIGLLRRHGDVLKNASSLLATTGVTSAMGFAYWTVAARLMSQRAVGFGSATVSAITLLATIGMFGLGTVLIGELPRRTRRGDLVSAALITSGRRLGWRCCCCRWPPRSAQIARSRGIPHALPPQARTRR